MFKERIYKIWKQFTTGARKILRAYQLCSKNEYTKSESNSQPHSSVNISPVDCVQRTNIQNLKAIHNSLRPLTTFGLIVFKERIYKIWKQFTTAINDGVKSSNCVQRTNIQNLKAIHNMEMNGPLMQKLCSKNEYTKSESNSQHSGYITAMVRDCVQRTNIQNLKAIHNCRYVRLDSRGIVFKERIYKIWKQFTTSSLFRFTKISLCSKNEYTKSESNSQLVVWSVSTWADCVQRTNIQNLKAIHNYR